MKYILIPLFRIITFPLLVLWIIFMIAWHYYPGIFSDKDEKFSEIINIKNITNYLLNKQQ